MTIVAPGPVRGWCALVPMRHDSERVPGKNHRLMQGKPLFTYIIETLRSVGEIDLIVVDTDSETIREVCASRYPEILVVERPDALRGGTVPMTAVIAHDVSLVPHQWFLQTHSTNPFLSPDSVRRAIRRLESSPTADSLFAVSPFYGRLFDEEGRAINHDPAVLVRTQDLPPVLIENSHLYLFPREAALAGRRIGSTPIMFEVRVEEALDIDTEHDWIMAELYAGYLARCG